MNRRLARQIVLSLHAVRPVINFAEFSARDWDRTLQWLHASGLTFYFLARAGESCSLPSQVLDRLRKDAASNRRRIAGLFEDFKAINGEFTAAGLSFAVQKGFSLVPDYCPEPAMRLQSDLDYLVAPESLEQARSILRSLGYTVENQPEGFSEFVLRTPSERLPTRKDFLDPPNKSVELHLNLWAAEVFRIPMPRLAGVLERTEWRAIRGHTFPVLTLEDAFIAQAVHAFKHVVMGWCRLSWLYEIGLFLHNRQDDTPVWQTMQARAMGDMLLREAMGVVLLLTEKIFGISAPPGLAAWTTELLPANVRLWMNRYGEEFVLSEIPGNKLALFLHELFVQDGREWSRYRRSKLFPLRRPKPFSGAPPIPTVAKSSYRFRQSSHVFGLVLFHFGATARYLAELPRWRWLTRNEFPRSLVHRDKKEL